MDFCLLSLFWLPLPLSMPGVLTSGTQWGNTNAESGDLIEAFLLPFVDSHSHLFGKEFKATPKGRNKYSIFTGDWVAIRKTGYVTGRRPRILGG